MEKSPKKLVISEPLCYIRNYLDKAVVSNIKKIVLGFYSDDEILNAKKILWDHYATFLNSCSERKSTVKRSAKEANLDDIITSIVKIDDGGVETVTFVVGDLSRCPKQNPEELNVVSLLERINNLEKGFELHENILTKHKLEVDVINNRLNTDEIDIRNYKGVKSFREGRISIVDSNELNSVSCNNDNNNKNDKFPISKSVKDIVKSFENEIESRAILSTSRFRKRFYSDSCLLDNFGNQNSALSNRETDQLECKKCENSFKPSRVFYNRQNKKKRLGIPICRGENLDSPFIRNNTNRSKYVTSHPRDPKGRPYSSNLTRVGHLCRGSCNRPHNYSSHRQTYADIFIYKVNSGNSGDILAQFRDRNVFIENIIKVSHPNSKFMSFKARINSTDFERVHSNGFLPYGAKVKYFR